MSFFIELNLVNIRRQTELWREFYNTAAMHLHEMQEIPVDDSEINYGLIKWKMKNTILNT